MLCGRKDLAHVSKKPGKTQALNYYLIDDSWYLVDLPGYGYAVSARKKRRSWSEMTTEYFLRCPTLQCAFVLVDANVPPQKHDIEFINWLGEEQIPFVLAYTKTDRLTKRRQSENIQTFQQALGEFWNTLPQEFITSSVNRAGREEILTFIARVNRAVERS
jgi:GTP-binding protein